MSPRSSRAQADRSSGPDRLSAEERRERLIDIAFELLRKGGPEGVTMGTVADRAEVTRALVYKHFANRDELLSALFRREMTKLDAAMVAEVEAAQGLEARLRTFVRAVLRALETHGWLFVPLQPQLVERAFRQEQRARDRRAVRGFAELASQELGLPRPVANAALAILLSGVSALPTLARNRASAAERARLEELYVALVLGGLERLKRIQS